MTLALQWMWRFSRGLAAAVLLAHAGAPALAANERIPLLRLPDMPLPFIETEDRPPRTGPFIEMGRGINETGPLSPGIEMLWGAVWQTAPWVHGAQRVADPSTDGNRRTRPKGDLAEMATRMGLFAEGDFPWGLLEVDVARTIAGWDRGDQVNSGVRWTGHSAGNNYSMHANFSRYFDPMLKKHDSGSLMALGYSTQVGLRRDILYANGYWAEGDFRRLAGSGPPPLGPIDLSFSGVGLGGHHPSLWPRPLDSAGFAVGMQTFFAEETAHLAVAVGHRHDLDKEHAMLGNTSATTLSTRARYRFGERFLLQMDAYYAIHDRDSKIYRNQDAENHKDSSALRVELRVSF